MFVLLLLSVFMAGAPHVAASQGNFAAGRGSVENLSTPPSTRGHGEPGPDAKPETVLSTPARSFFQDAQSRESFRPGDTYVDWSEDDRAAPPMDSSGGKGETKAGSSKAEPKDAMFWKNHGCNNATQYTCPPLLHSIYARPVFLQPANEFTAKDEAVLCSKERG